MGDLVISINDLQTLLRIIGDLTASSDCTHRLDRAIANLKRLVPFRRCVLRHERSLEPSSVVSVYEAAAGAVGEGMHSFRCGRQFLEIRRHLEAVQPVQTFQNAFFWCGAGADGSAVAFEDQQGEAVTMMWLDYAQEQFAASHLFFLNSVVSHVQGYFVRCAACFRSSGVQPRLTSKEREVLKWVMQGKTSWEVGTILSVSERTVKFHLRNIYVKLNVVNRAQAVTMASKLRLV
jgi:LuxR family quorum-sensing system transcriptional regulator SolR